jgi:hypothetical protein
MDVLGNTAVGAVVMGTVFTVVLLVLVVLVVVGAGVFSTVEHEDETELAQDGNAVLVVVVVVVWGRRKRR